jgi:hypothetical protein
MKSVHYFKIRNEEEPPSHFYSNIVEILDGDDSGIVVNEFTSYEVLYTFLEEEKVKSLKSLLESHDLLIEDRDLTAEILKSKLNDEEFVETFSDVEYSKILENFVLENLSVDDVLDKISESGYESLTHLEKQVLQSV